jgi:6-phosphofructokinase 1
MKKKIGIVTGGGDCPGLNAVIRAAAKAAAMRGWETVGILGGYEGLIEPRQFCPLDYHALSGLLVRGGTILGTANRGKFSSKTGHGDSRQLPKELLDGVKAGMEALGIFALVSIGGDGSLTIAQQMHEAGVPVVGVPKTIDNDLAGTLMTFGFDSAVTCATDALDRLHTTAESHNRVMVLEVMGRYAGWIALYAGVAGGADVVLIPEIPFSYDSVCAKIRERESLGKKFTLVVVAEGAREKDADFVTSAGQEANREARLVSAPWSRRSWRSERARRRATACSATCNAAGARPRSTAPSVPCSGPRPWNSSPPVTSAKWWPSPAPALGQ